MEHRTGIGDNIALNHDMYDDVPEEERPTWTDYLQSKDGTS